MLRRSFLKGLGALFVAPAIIRAENLMPIKEYMPEVPAWCPPGWLPLDGREISKKFYPELYAMHKKLHYPTTHLSDYQPYDTYAGYDPIDFRKKKEIQVISYKTMIRPNGRIMLPGALCPITVYEDVV